VLPVLALICPNVATFQKIFSSNPKVHTFVQQSITRFAVQRAKVLLPAAALLELLNDPPAIPMASQISFEGRPGEAKRLLYNLNMMLLGPRKGAEYSTVPKILNLFGNS